MSHKPSGEVAAISGYNFQYELFATELYNCLLNYEIEWVEFASSNFGKLDDVLIGLDKKVIAYQIKEISSSTFSYLQFTQSETESILEGVYKGWKNLKEKYPDKKIDARFITTQSVSENDSIAAFKGSPKASFEKLVKNLWNPIQRGDYTDKTIPEVWKPVIKELSDLVKATTSELIEFIRDFTFVFDYKLNYYNFDTYTKARRDTDIDRITKHIFRLVAKKGNVRFKKSEFISEFGLKNQFETRFQHSFFIDEKHYQHLISTAENLDRIIQKKEMGYIALVGNAGAGKSTLLTKWLSEKECKVLKYYAYTNTDMSYDFGFRGEATYFLHDMLVQIREGKLSQQDYLPENELLDLQKHFHEELQKISRNNEKVFIIVDGLDHIDREQKVSKSLIEVLPEPAAVPRNVYLILGSRTIEMLENLSFEIINELKESDSIVCISQLSKENILNLIGSYGLQLPPDAFEILCSNTKGHPLFLRYTLEELLSVGESQYESVIKKNKFSGDIYKEYQKFWNRFRDDDGFVQILGLISRFRFPYFDTRLLRLFKIKGSDASRVNKVSEFYFYKSEYIWQFFHNSFKEFLIEQSAKDRFTGDIDRVIDKEYHLQIAEAIRETDNEYRFNELYHLFKAERFKAVTQLTSQKYFRQQWFAYRNNNIIFEDIKLALQSCFIQRDYKSLIACFFSYFELEQRTNNFLVREHFRTFLLIGRPDIANSLVFNNARLLVDNQSALEYSRLLFSIGQKGLAKELFDRATPGKLLESSAKLSTRRYSPSDHSEYNELKLISAWGVTASLFMPIEDIVQKLRRLSVEEDPFGGTPRDPISETLGDIADSFIELEDWESLVALADIYDSEMDLDERFYFYFDLLNALDSENKLYERCIKFFESWEITDTNNINIRYLIVFTLFKQNIEKCKGPFQNLTTPKAIYKELASTEQAGISNYIFNYSRLFYIINKDFSASPTLFLPISDKPSFNAFYHTFAELGKAYAWIYYNYKDASIGFFLTVDKVFDLFHCSVIDPFYEYSIANSKNQLVTLILKVSSKISEDLFNKVLEKVDNEWQINNRFWKTKEIQEVIDWTVESKLNPYWCIQQLEKLDSYIFQTGYLEERLEDGIKQAELWCNLGLEKRGETTVDQLMSLSFDIRGEKDYQLDYLVGWISKFEPIDSQEVQFYFDRLESLNDKVNSPSHTPARELFRMSLSLGNGFNVFSYLLFEGLEEFCDGLESVLGYLFSRIESLRMVCIKVFTSIVLSLDNSHGTRRHFISQFFKSEPSLHEISTLIANVRIYAIHEVKLDYLFAIQEELLSLGIDPALGGIEKTIERKREHGGAENILRLRSGELFREKDLLIEIDNLNDIKALEDKAEENSYFKWNNLINKIIPSTGEEDLSDFLLSRDFRSVELAEFAKTSIDYGKIGVAKKLIEQALSKSSPTGWVDIYDGGSKICAFNELRRIEQKPNVQERILRDFSESINELDIRAMEIITGKLDEVFNLFCEPSRQDIYDEIVKFRNELLKNHTLNTHRIPIAGNETDLDLTVEILYFLITFPSSFSEIIFPYLIKDQAKLNAIIERLLSKLYSDGFNLKFVQFVAGLAKNDLNFVNKYKNELSSLLNHQRFDVSRLAAKILESINYEAHFSPRCKTRDILLSYTIHLTPIKGIIDAEKKPIDNIDDSGFLKDTEDPIAYTRIFSFEIKKLAAATGLNPYNIAYRIMLLGRDPEFPKWCNALNEEELRTMYDSRFHLKIGYKRPRVQRVIAGLMMVLRELIEVGLIDEDFAESIAGSFDELVYFFEVSERPPFVTSILSPTGTAPSANAKWPKAIGKEYLQEALKLSDNSLLILAEYTKIVGMGHGNTAEVRQSLVDLAEEVDLDVWTIFNYIFDKKVEDYPYLKEGGICLYNFVNTIEPKETWVAINPLLALDLGLKYNDKEGNFRWDDENGNMVIESIFWEDGNVTNQSGHHNSEAGHGWAVIMTQTGIARLSAVLEGEKLFFHRKVQRNINFVQRRYNTHIDEQGTEYYREEVDFTAILQK